MLVVTHRIAGITFRTESTARLPLLHYGGVFTFAPFRVEDNAAPDVCQRIRKVGLDALTLPPLTAGEQERLSHAAHCAPADLKSPLLRAPAVRARLFAALDQPGRAVVHVYPDRVVVYDLARCELDLFYTEAYGKYDTRMRRTYTADERAAGFIRPMFAVFFPCFSAIQVHGAGVIRDGQAALFMARDGGGKTTVLSHAAGGGILSDDQIVLRREEGGVVAHATPLGSMTSGPCQAPVGAIFILHKAPHFELKPLRATDVMQPIWRENWGHIGFLPRELKARAFEVLCDACMRTPVYQMCFPKDYVDWDAIDAAMAAGG